MSYQAINHDPSEWGGVEAATCERCSLYLTEEEEQTGERECTECITEQEQEGKYSNFELDKDGNNIIL